MSRLQIPGAVQAGTGMITPQAENAVTPGVSAIPGQQLQDQGRAIMGMGETGLKIYNDMQMQVNKTRITEAQNAAWGLRNKLTMGTGRDGEPIGFLSLRGWDAVELDKKSMSAVYNEKLKTGLSEIEDGLANDVQKAAFQVWRGQFEADFDGAAKRHQLSEYKAHDISVSEGMLERSMQEAIAGYQYGANEREARIRWAIDGQPVPGNDTQRMGGLRQAAYDLAIKRGKSETEAGFESSKAVSKAHLNVIGQALIGKNESFAVNYLEKNKSDMLPSDIVEVSRHLNEHIDMRSAVMAVDGAEKMLANRIQPAPMDGIVGVVRYLESGGQGDFGKDGKPLTSKAGAMYEMQVRPGTAENPGYGITPARDKSPQEYNRVGREYLGAMMKEFGNPAMALAAYNAGPGVDSKTGYDARGNPLPGLRPAIARARARGQEQNWISELPEETQSYVARGTKMIEQGAGVPARPTEFEFVGAAVELLGPNATPEAVKNARSMASQRYAMFERAIKDKEDAAVADAMRWLDANGGRYSQMPLSLVMNVPPKEKDGLRNYGARVAKGDDTTDRAAYLQLLDPGKLKNMSDNEFYRYSAVLSEADYKQLARERETLRSGKAANGPEDLNTGAIADVLRGRLTSMGWDMRPTGKDAQKIAELTRVVRQSILSAQSVSGKKMTDLDVEKHIDGLFAKDVEFRNVGLFGGVELSRENLFSMKAGGIPRSSYEAIKKDFEKRGIKPSEDQILGAYWMAKVAAK